MPTHLRHAGTPQMYGARAKSRSGGAGSGPGRRDLPGARPQGALPIVWGALGRYRSCPISSPLYQLAESDAEQTALCVLVKTKEPKIEWHTAVRSGDELAILAKIPSVIPGTSFKRDLGIGES